MNRLQLWDHPLESTSQDRSDDGRTMLAGGDQDGHALFAPLHYEPNYAYPLVVWLHGPDDNETQLQRVMPGISMRNYVGVGPRGNAASVRGYSWSDGDLESAEQAVFSCIDLARDRFHIAPRRVFLAGFDCGGSIALRIGLRHPSCFAGALSVGGPFPQGSMPLARLNQARDLPLFIAQGRDSQQYPTELACDELRLFHAAGLYVTLRQYPCGDELDSLMLRDMDAWMMELVTGVASSEQSTDSRSAGELN